MGMSRKMARNFFGLVKEVMWSKHIQECSTILLLVAWCAFPFFSWFIVVTKTFAGTDGCQKFMNFSNCVYVHHMTYDAIFILKLLNWILYNPDDGILKLLFENVQPQINKCTSFTYSFSFPRGPNLLVSLKEHRSILCVNLYGRTYTWSLVKHICSELF